AYNLALHRSKPKGLDDSSYMFRYLVFKDQLASLPLKAARSILPHHTSSDQPVIYWKLQPF
ncbi:hypothetical protein M5X16_29685, partial [Paenibacillus chitinolyticus]